MESIRGPSFDCMLSVHSVSKTILANSCTSDTASSNSPKWG